MLKKICEHCKGTGQIDDLDSITIPLWDVNPKIEIINYNEISSDDAYKEGEMFIKLTAAKAHGRFFDGMRDEMRNH